MRYAVAILSAACIWAQPALDRPMLGQMLDREGVLRPVAGVGGSFQLDQPAARWILSTACSRELCVAKTNLAVVSGSFTTAAPAGSALIGIDSAAAVLYFPAANQFARWQEGALTPLDIRVEGEVMAVRSLDSRVSVAERRDSGVWIVADDGTILDSLPAKARAVLLLPDSVVYSIATEVVLRKTGGVELRFAAAGITALLALGEDYVQGVTPDAAYALRTIAGREQLFVLPQTPPTARFSKTR